MAVEGASPAKPFRWLAGSTSAPTAAESLSAGTPGPAWVGTGKPLQGERQDRVECGFAQQVSAEVSKWVRVNRRP